MVLILLIAIAACSGSKPSGSGQAAAKPAPKPAELETGREAFQRLYVAARGWAPDTQPFRLESDVTSDSNGHDGKSAVWRASFASPSRGALKTYVWSGSGAEGATRGIRSGSEDTFNPANSFTQRFNINFLKIDSDKAFAVAQQHGGEKLMKSTPNQPVLYLLDWNPRQNELIWHVMYGSSRNDAKLTIDVNATTGDFIRVER